MITAILLLALMQPQDPGLAPLLRRIQLRLRCGRRS